MPQLRTRVRGGSRPRSAGRGERVARRWPRRRCCRAVSGDRGDRVRLARGAVRGTRCGVARAAARSRRLLLLACRSRAGPCRRGRRLGVVWFDAHGDLNTPETSPSGNLWGMPLRMLIDSDTVDAEDVALVGARNLDPGEEAFIAEMGIDDSLDRRSKVSTRSTSRSTWTCSIRPRLTVFMPEPDGPSVEGRRSDSHAHCRAHRDRGHGRDRARRLTRPTSPSSRACSPRPVSEHQSALQVDPA